MMTAGNEFSGIDYNLIPEHMRHSLRGYIEFGHPIGGFLTYVLSNDLVHAYGTADEINTAAMHDWASWLWMECPSPAWGSPEKVREWQQRRQREQVMAAETRSGLRPCTKYAKEEAR